MKTQEVIYKEPSDGNGPIPMSLWLLWLGNRLPVPPCMKCAGDLRITAEALDFMSSVINQLGQNIAELPDYSKNLNLQEIRNDLDMHMKSFSSLRTGIAQTSLKVAIISEEMG